MFEFDAEKAKRKTSRLEMIERDTFERVKACLSEVLAIDPKTIGDDDSLINDLGADSLDLVELMFVLERNFSVRLNQDDLRLTKQLGLTDEEIHVDEVLTPRALEVLRERFPNSLGVLVAGTTRRGLAVLLTVRQVAESIEAKRAARA